MRLHFSATRLISSDRLYASGAFRHLVGKVFPGDRLWTLCNWGGVRRSRRSVSMLRDSHGYFNPEKALRPFANAIDKSPTNIALALHNICLTIQLLYDPRPAIFASGEHLEQM